MPFICLKGTTHMLCTNHANTISHHNKMNIEIIAPEIVYAKQQQRHPKYYVQRTHSILFLSVILCSNLKIWILKLFECVMMMMLMMVMIRLSIFSMGYVCRHVEKSISLTRKYEIVVWRLKWSGQNDTTRCRHDDKTVRNTSSGYRESEIDGVDGQCGRYTFVCADFCHLCVHTQTDR